MGHDSPARSINYLIENAILQRTAPDRHDGARWGDAGYAMESRDGRRAEAGTRRAKGAGEGPDRAMGGRPDSRVVDNVRQWKASHLLHLAMQTNAFDRNASD